MNIELSSALQVNNVQNVNPTFSKLPNFLRVPFPDLLPHYYFKKIKKLI